GKDANPETLRGPGFLKSIFLLSGKQPAWTIVAQEDGGGGFMVRSTTHVETLLPKDSKIARLRSVQGDLGRVVGTSKGDGLYYRTAGVRFLPLAEAAAPSAPVAGGGPGLGPGGLSTRFAVTADGKIAYESNGGQLVRFMLDSGEREFIPFQAQ